MSTVYFDLSSGNLVQRRAKHRQLSRRCVVIGNVPGAASGTQTVTGWAVASAEGFDALARLSSIQFLFRM